jgi:hypothetical protein
VAELQDFPLRLLRFLSVAAAAACAGFRIDVEGDVVELGGLHVLHRGATHLDWFRLDALDVLDRGPSSLGASVCTNKLLL